MIIDAIKESVSFLFSDSVIWDVEECVDVLLSEWLVRGIV